MKVFLLGVLFLALAMTATPDSRTQLDELIARAKSLELDTPYVPPPGDPLVHHAAGYAKAMCSAVFITGLSHYRCHTAEAGEPERLIVVSKPTRNCLKTVLRERDVDGA